MQTGEAELVTHTTTTVSPPSPGWPAELIQPASELLRCEMASNSENREI